MAANRWMLVVLQRWPNVFLQHWPNVVLQRWFNVGLQRSTSTTKCNVGPTMVQRRFSTYNRYNEKLRWPNVVRLSGLYIGPIYMRSP